MANSDFELFSRRMITFGLLDLLIMLLIFSTLSFTESSIILGLSLGFGFLSILYGLIVVIGFARRSIHYELKLANFLSFVSGFFLIIGGIQFLIAILANDLILSLQGILLILLANSTRKRTLTLRHPKFVSWYNNQENSASVLSTNEVFATCPSCNSLLAVIPQLLTIEDKCPHCNGFLVIREEE